MDTERILRTKLSSFEAARSLTSRPQARCICHLRDVVIDGREKFFDAGMARHAHARGSERKMLALFLAAESRTVLNMGWHRRIRTATRDEIHKGSVSGPTRVCRFHVDGPGDPGRNTLRYARVIARRRRWPARSCLDMDFH